MSYHFHEILDTPDIILKPHQWLIAQYSYMWGPLARTRTYRREIPLQIHLKDLLKMREQALQQLWIQNQHLLQGDPPKLFNFQVAIADTTEN